MTRRELADACAMYTPTAPVTVDDCREIYADLKPQIPAGLALDVVLINERTIRVTVGAGDSAHSVDLQA